MDFESIRGMSGLMFPDGPRWRDRLFWFSDILAGRVHAITPEGKLVDSFDVPGEPSGLGWLPLPNAHVEAFQCLLSRFRG